MPDDAPKAGLIFAEESATTRTHTVSTKLNANELAEFNALAQFRGLLPGELLRVLVKDEQERRKTGSVASPELIELAGIRLLLNNYLRPLAQGKTKTADEDKTTMAGIQERKKTLAQEILEGVKE